MGYLDVEKKKEILGKLREIGKGITELESILSGQQLRIRLQALESRLKALEEEIGEI